MSSSGIPSKTYLHQVFIGIKEEDEQEAIVNGFTPRGFNQR
ncbi:hypothetical protein [Providencia rettgeri]|nr:hypothetical protein [Providencia rettgeri]